MEKLWSFRMTNMKLSPAPGTRVTVTAADHERCGKSGVITGYHGHFPECAYIRLDGCLESELIALADIEPELPEAA